jgi:hypothetical protein
MVQNEVYPKDASISVSPRAQKIHFAKFIFFCTVLG